MPPRVPSCSARRPTLGPTRCRRCAASADLFRFPPRNGSRGGGGGGEEAAGCEWGEQERRNVLLRFPKVAQRLRGLLRDRGFTEEMVFKPL